MAEVPDSEEILEKSAQALRGSYNPAGSDSPTRFLRICAAPTVRRSSKGLIGRELIRIYGKN